MKTPDQQPDEIEHLKEERREPKPEQQAGIVQPMIEDLLPRREPGTNAGVPARGPIHPPQPAELDQDAGGGYNPDHSIPQP